MTGRPTYAGLDMRGTMSPDMATLYTTAVLHSYQLQYSPLRAVALPSGDAHTIAPWDLDLNQSFAAQQHPVSCLAAAPDGLRLFVCHRAAIRVIDLASAAVTTVAGRLGAAPAIVDGPCSAARFAGPEALLFTTDGDTLYLIDDVPMDLYFALRKITFSGAGGAGCVVTTLANDEGKAVGQVLADGPPESATLGDVWSLALSPDGLFLYVISYTYACVRAVSTATGYVTTYTGQCAQTSAGDVVGGALNARYSVPEMIVEVGGALFIHDKGNRKVACGGRACARRSAALGTFGDFRQNCQCDKKSSLAEEKMGSTNVCMHCRG